MLPYISIELEDNSEAKHDVGTILRVTVTSPGARRKRDLIILFTSGDSRDAYLDKMFVAMERVRVQYPPNRCAWLLSCLESHLVVVV